MSNNWSLNQVTNQSGKTAIITGANVGLGYETALAFAGKGMKVILACRNLEKAETAKHRILDLHPKALLEIRHIDTSSLQSVRQFAKGILADYDQLDLLINNAGIMMTPFSLSEDGFENQLATNYLGHFLLTGLLLPLISQVKDSRVVTLSSLAHSWSGIQFDDINFEKSYVRSKAYSQSKAACLVFAIELQRRLTAANSPTLSLAAHPGFSDTQLVRNMPLIVRMLSPLLSKFMSQSAADGAAPTLYAALGKNLKGGEFIGPAGSNQRKGLPTVVDFDPSFKSPDLGQRLWTLSEQMTDIQYL